MIVVCNNCNAKYDVKDEVIPAQGAQLKCAKCGKMIFVTKSSQDNENKQTEVKKEHDIPEPFSDFDERPTILAPESFHETFKLNNDAPIDEDASSKSGISPNFLSDQHKEGPSFEDVFDDFEEEISNEEKEDKKNKSENKKVDKPEEKKKSGGFDDALDDFFDDLVKDEGKEVDKPEKISEKSDKKEGKSDNIENVQMDEIEEIEVDDEPTLDISSLNEMKKEEENKKQDEKQESSKTEPATNVKVGINDSETQEISNLKMNELKEQLKDGLTDTDFTDSRSNIEEEKSPEKKVAKIYVKVENGPSIEFQMEKDLIDWLKAKSSLKGVMYSLDDIEYSPILNHQLFKDVEEILKKGKEEIKEEVIPASKILENKKERGGSSKFLLVLLLLIAVAELGVIIYLLNNKSENNSVVQNEVKVKISKKVKKQVKNESKYVEQVDKNENKPKVEEKSQDKTTSEKNQKEIVENNENMKTPEEKKTINQENENNNKDKNKKAEKVEEKPKDNPNPKTENIEKISPKEKRNYYRQARLAFKAKNIEEAKKRFLTIAYNYPKEAEAYGVLFAIFKKDKENKKYAVKFLKAYKALTSEKENTFVDKKLIEKLYKK